MTKILETKMRKTKRALLVCRNRSFPIKSQFLSRIFASAVHAFFILKWHVNGARLPHGPVHHTYYKKSQCPTHIHLLFRSHGPRIKSTFHSYCIDFHDALTAAAKERSTHESFRFDEQYISPARMCSNCECNQQS